MSGCLTDDQVLAFVSAELPASDRSAADEHLATCADCRTVLAEAARSLYEPETSLAVSRGHTLWGVGRVRPDVALQPLAPGTFVGRYQIVRPVGRGGSGVVYEAFDPQLGRKVAIKMVRPDAGDEPTQGRGRLLREAQAMARLAHQNVVYVHDAGTFEGQVFVAMEFVDGRTVGQWLRQHNPGWREILRVFIDAGRGLAAAHEAGIVHRDFKPENVLMGNDGRPRVTDFGLARSNLPGDDVEVADAPLPPIAVPPTTPGEDPPGTTSLGLHPLLTLTEAGALAGTPAYMAPEQWKGGRADERSDQFNFCAAVWRSLSGHRPFGEGPGETVTMTALARAVLAGELRAPPANSPIPAAVFAALRRGLSGDPGARFPSISALLEALISAAAPTDAIPATTVQRSRPVKRMLLGAGGVVAAAAGMLFLVTRTPERPSSSSPPSFSSPSPAAAIPPTNGGAPAGAASEPIIGRSPPPPVPAPTFIEARTLAAVPHASAHHPIHHLHRAQASPPAPAAPPPRTIGAPASESADGEHYGRRLKDPFAANPGAP